MENIPYIVEFLIVAAVTPYKCFMVHASLNQL